MVSSNLVISLYRSRMGRQVFGNKQGIFSKTGANIKGGLLQLLFLTMIQDNRMFKEVSLNVFESVVAMEVDSCKPDFTKKIAGLNLVAVGLAEGGLNNRS